MQVDGWLSNFGDPITAGDLESPAVAVVSFAQRHAPHIAKFIEARRGPDGELAVFDFQTGRPQDSAYPIKRIERIGVRFAQADAMPVVYMLRDDFPDTDHQLLTAEGSPRAICIDDRIWAEARLTWTPADLIHRILSWFSRAARGELHDARQPLDPLIIGSSLSFIISRDVLHRAADLDLVGVHDPKHRQTLRVRPVQDVRESIETIEPICLAAYRIAPEKMQRLAFAPDNLGSLADMLTPRGVYLFDDLRARFSGWLAEQTPPAWRINARFAVILEMPIIAPDGAQQEGTDLRAFITGQSVGEIAVALGAAIAAEPGEGSKVGFVKPLTPQQVDPGAVRAIAVQSLEIHYEFDRKLATRLSGRHAEDDRKVVMAGAGAIGSHVADCLVREGRFRWTIIDDDRLLPHNLARHIARSGGITKEKASLVANDLTATLEDVAPVARSIFANVMTEGPARAEIDQALEQADLIIDSTASVLAERYLSDHAAAARRASIFFNPAGDAAVLLAEPADRSLTLRELEAQYLSLVARDSALVGHLAPPAGTYAYTGACRAITNLIPQSRVMALSGLVAGGLTKATDQDGAAIRIWSLRESGAVEVREPAVTPADSFEAGEWTVSIDQGLTGRILTMRAARLPEETGGVLTGIVDIPAKQIQLVDAAPAPPDSKAGASGFERGTSGVQEYLERVFEQTRGQVRYVGEWHSHPPRVAALPSPTDLSQIDWLATLFDMDTLPALMLIAGDHHVSIILANRQAEPAEADSATAAKHGKGGLT